MTPPLPPPTTLKIFWSLLGNVGFLWSNCLKSPPDRRLQMITGYQFRPSNIDRLSLCTLVKQSRGQIHGRNWDKSLKSFSPCYSQSPTPPPPPNKSGLKLVCNVKIVYENLRSENSHYYAQKPQRNCKFMNSASGLCLMHNAHTLDAMMCPRPRTPLTFFLGRCAPCTKCSANEASMTDVTRSWTAYNHNKLLTKLGFHRVARFILC
jgi:hypothetical protein